MTLETVKALRTDGLTALSNRFGILVKRHGTFPNLVQLKYSQRESPMGEAIVQECRGLILDEADDWAVVALPFTKFFNHGEPHAHPIDWATARVYEKLDGSLMTLYPYRGKWHVASSSVPDASGPTGGTFAGTFADLFNQTWSSLGYTMPRAAAAAADDDVRACFMFELMTPHNRIVCRHAASRVVLTGARDIDTLIEQDPEHVASTYGWPCARSFPLTTLQECLTAACAIDPMEGEGYVVRDAAFRRIKIKSSRYVAIAHLKEGLSGRRMLEVIRANEAAELLTHFPELRPFHDRIRKPFEDLCDAAEASYRDLKNINDRKDFAASAVRTSFPAVLFALRDAKASTAREFFATCTLPALERLIEIDLDEFAQPGMATET